MSSIIRVLPDGVINRIAAGEVVDRPAAVVKELLENSLDAGAGEVEVRIEGAGRRLIRVRDDGCGLSRDDTLLAFERHATSKIYDVDDLWRVGTLGFRGEALPSIAAVSRVDCWTSREGEVTGTHLYLDGGILKRVEDAACAKGFTIAVRRLFYNTPARLKFLKSDRTEARQVTAVVTHYALAHPDRHFRLWAGDRPLVDAFPVGSRKERVVHLFGENLASELLEFAREKGGLKVEGFASAPGLHRSSREQQYFFVNGRYVRDRVLLSAVAEAYETRLVRGRYPVVFLFLQIPPEELDVNVHPTKLEVRFRKADQVRRAVVEAVEAGLRPMSVTAASTGCVPWTRRSEVLGRVPRQDDPIPSPARHPSHENHAGSSPRGSSMASVETGVDGRDALRPLAQRVATTAFTAAAAQGASATQREDHRSQPPIPETERQLGFPALPDLDILGEIGATYIVVKYNGGLLIVDQHAAHERLRYEDLLQEIAAGAVRAQKLAVPLTLPLTPSELSVAEEHREELAGLGFEVETFGPGTLLARSVPSLWAEEDPATLLSNLIDTLVTEGRLPSGEAMARRLAAIMACHGSVRAHQRLPREAAEALVKSLEERPWLSTCPHGRPLYLLLSVEELARRFLRT